MAVLENIIYKKSNSNPTLDCDDAYYELPFRKDDEYFSVVENYIGFVKNVESMVRSSKEYRKYKDYLMNDLGMDRCQVLSNVDKDSAPLEMHHGPILSLFDIVSIILDDQLLRGKKVTTFGIADLTLQAHFDNIIQVVILSETVHQQWHATGKPFINVKQAFGDLNAFTKRFKYGIDNTMAERINRYIDLSNKYESNDSGSFDVKDNVEKWGNIEIV